ncbi:MAG: phage major capsid protein [Gammaproteobacteria bacterium]
MSSDSTAIQEKREHFHAKQDGLTEVFKLARDGSGYDFSRKTVLEKLKVTDQHEAMRKVRALNKELEDLGNELRNSEMKNYESRLSDRDDELATPGPGTMQHPKSGHGARKTLGALYIASDQWKQFKAHKSREAPPFHVELELKTLFQTSAGFLPESVRSDLLVEAVTRPIQVTDLIPSFPINQPSFVYMEETTRTHAAVEKAEGAAAAESTFVWTEKTSVVRKIFDSIPVTDEQLEDELQIQSLLDQRLRFGVRQRLDLQILVGDGVAPNLEGINNVTGIQTQALGTDDRITAFSKALTLIRFTGRATPSGAVFHPNDWQAYMLLKNANGDFLFGNPFTGPGPQSLLGVPIAVSDAQTENTGLIGDFANFSRLDDRRGVMVQIGFVGTQFTEGKVTMRADLRTAFTVTRPAAFATLTGI